MEFKGTKGEWMFDDLNMKITGTGDIEGKTIIANVSPKMNYSRGMTTQIANAQLISKAPEMLEMLQRVLSDHGNVGIIFADRAEEIEQLIKEATEIK